MKIIPKYAELPAAGIAATLNGTVAGHGGAVVTAPPGAGKSTLLPLTLLEGIGSGRILMLEPRRIAARQIAERMAFMIGESVGQTVGYRIRFESKLSSMTRIEVITEGILTRMLVEDPTLDGVSMLIFDEFHERSLASDVALTLARESRSLVRPDLALVIMSATMDADFICRALDLPLVESEGRMFPVETVYAQPSEAVDPADFGVEPVCDRVCAEVHRAHTEHDGDMLVFLPGEAEIRRCAERMDGHLGSTSVMPLYGMLSSEEQRRAIAPSAPGERKIVLATPIAETSITIEGVRVVVDSGLCRRLSFDHQSGLSRLETVRISQDMADQRRGRAGRVAPGVCYRLWTMATQSQMSPCRRPEILDADLAPVLLDAAAWGTSDIMSLPWLTPPPAASLARAGRLLSMLGAIDDNGRITPHGRSLEELPCHPRIASMLLRSGSIDSRALAADIAALLEDRDPMAGRGDQADLTLRVAALRSARLSHARSLERAVRAAAQYRRMVAAPEDNSSPDPYEIGALVAAAWPERVARAHRDGCGRFLLSSGEIAAVSKDDPLASCEWLAVASVGGARDRQGRIFLAAPVDTSDLMPLCRERDNVSWDSRRGCVLARHEFNIGVLLVDERPIHGSVRDRMTEVICEAARREGTSMLDFDKDVMALVRRVAALASWHPELELPDLSPESVLDRAHEWLPLYAAGATNVQDLRRIDLRAALWGLLSYEQQCAVDRLAPTHIAVPSGNRIRVEYRQGADAPVLRVRLQECFGMMDTPAVDGGRLPVLMELLSPGFKPVQLTSDLRSFWSGTYFEVRKELRRRYPKHAWPDNPTVVCTKEK